MIDSARLSHYNNVSDYLKTLVDKYEKLQQRAKELEAANAQKL